MKSLWVKSIWVKNMGENRGRWDAGFRSPLLRYIYMLYTTHTHIYIYLCVQGLLFCQILEDAST